jgi:hypothetical protein
VVGDADLQRARDDFRVFVFILWKHLRLADPTPAQYALAKFLQHGPKRCGILAFRGVGKSWLTSGFVVWLLWRNPNIKVMVVSASKDRAVEFSTFVKQILAFPFLSHLQPRVDQRNSVLSFDVAGAEPSHSPSVKSIGITGALAGSRADVIVSDDVEIQNNSATQDMRDKLGEKIKEFDAILKPLDTSRIIFLGTPQSEMSIYNQLPGRGYTIRIWPAEYPQISNVDRYKGQLFPEVARAMALGKGKAGAPTDPLRFNSVDLQERRLSYGASGYALQFMLDTTLSDADKHPLKLSDLIVTDLHAELAKPKMVWASGRDQRIDDIHVLGLEGDSLNRPMWQSDEMLPYQGIIMAIDPSGRGTDETGYAVLGHLDSLLFAPAFGGLKGGYDEETLTKIAMIAARYKVNRIVIESNFGDGMFTQLLMPYLRKIHPCSVEELNSSKQKDLRIIDVMEPVLNQHRLVVDATALRDDSRQALEPSGGGLQYSLAYQLSRISKEPKSLSKYDRLDALAIGVGFLNKVLALGTEDAAQRRVEEARDKQLREFVERCTRKGTSGRTIGPRGSGNRAMRA